MFPEDEDDIPPDGDWEQVLDMHRRGLAQREAWVEWAVNQAAIHAERELNEFASDLIQRNRDEGDRLPPPRTPIIQSEYNETQAVPFRQYQEDSVLDYPGKFPLPTSPVSCCLYPWPDPSGTPLYPATDLPDTLNIDACGATVTLARVGYTYSGTLSGGRSIIVTPSDIDQWRVYIDPDDFLGSGCFYNSGDLTASCLIDDYPAGLLVAGCSCRTFVTVSDSFADTYTVDGADTITRTAICQWSGPKTLGGTWTLDYGVTTPYKWHLSSTGGAPSSDDKSAPQSSPAGTYGGIAVT